MRKTLFFIKSHYPAFILAVVVGLITVGPFLLQIASLGSAYKGIIYSDSGDDYTYLARIQEVIDGHPLASSPYFFEYKNLPPVMLPFGEYFYAWPALIFHLRGSSLLIIAKFLFPAILFCLIYFLINRLTVNPERLSNKINAIAAGLFVLLGQDLWNPMGWARLLGGQASFPSIWARPVNPITGAILLFVFLHILLSIYRKGNRWLFVPAGAVLAFMTAYFFSWGIALSITGTLFLILLFKKEYATSLKAFGLIGLAFVLSSPYWYFLLKANGDAANLSRNGMFFGHAPIFNKFVVAGLLIFLAFFMVEWYRNRKSGQPLKDWWLFNLAIIVGSFLVYNEQVITGRTVWPAHFIQYSIPLVIVIASCLLYNQVKARFPRLWILIVSLILVGALADGAAQAMNYKRDLNDLRQIQNDFAIFDWFDKNAAKDCVIFTADESLQFLLPAYTKCNDYLSGWNFSGVSKERIYSNYLASLKFKGVNSQTINAYLRDNTAELVSQFAPDWNVLFGKQDADWLKGTSQKIADDFIRFDKLKFDDELKKYRLDYLLSKGELTPAEKKLLPGLRPLKQLDGWFVYGF